MPRTHWGALCCSVWLFACSTGKGSEPFEVAPPDGPGKPSGYAGTGSFSPIPGAGGSFAVAPLVVDERPPVVADVPPPPISGGTLVIASDGVTAIAADPDRDRVSFVNLQTGQVLGHAALERGDEPGRIALDAAGRVHVALRGSGAIATIDPASRAISARRGVCAAPRGIAYESAGDRLHVACASGELVTMRAQDGQAIRTLHLGTDLRDVVAHPDRLLVSRFKSATVLELDAGEGEVMAEHRPNDVTQRVAIGSQAAFFGPTEHSFAPSLARRTIALSDGRALVLHERAMSDEVEINDPHDPGAGSDADPGFFPGGFAGSGGGGGYGSGDSCHSIVQTAVSVVGADGTILQSSSLAGSVLAVDLAQSPDGTTIAIANAGLRDPFSPRFFGPPTMIFGAPPPPLFDGVFGSAPGSSLGSISFIHTGEPMFHATTDLGDSCNFNSVPVPGQPTAVAYAPDGTLVIQSREPARLMLVSSAGLRTLELGGDSRLDTGHELFHRDAGGGIACASCHGEGGDDGHVWQFRGLGPRRTQSVNIGLRDTAPFHWSGDMRDLPTLVSEVFVGRMGGTPQSPTRVEAFSSWLFAQRPVAAPRAADHPAALRGRALFESKEVGCANCHNGEKLTNNTSADVGTGGVFQVPSLVGIAYRAPFIHNGCAATLRDRFDPVCGGDRHGNLAGLGDAELDDLVAYLETL
jgi:DNA-binding beta-propeller fold protein YncE/mono/diheme cytochrome c family protein